MEDYVKYISPVTAQLPLAVVEAARQLYGSHRKIMIVEGVHDSFQQRSD